MKWLVPSDTNPAKTYTIQFKDGIWSCSCPAWKNQHSPITHRTCKHLIRFLGDSHEQKRAIESFHGLTRGSSSSSSSRTKRHDHGLSPMSFHRWEEKDDLTNWYSSIKMNGAFGRWHRGQLYSKTGRLLHPPTRITQHLPKDVTLDGEIYAGLHGMNQVRRAVLADTWSDQVQFVVFDVAVPDLPFRERLEILQKLHAQHKFPMVKYKQIRDFQQFVKKDLPVFYQNGEEGLVLRHPDSLYEAGKRSRNTLKWKPAFESEGVIIKIEKKKRGHTLTLQELTGIQFRMFVSSSPPQGWKLNQLVRFVYHGRDEEDKPEFPHLLSNSIVGKRRRHNLKK